MRARDFLLEDAEDGSYVIYVNGEPVAHFPTQEEAERVIVHLRSKGAGNSFEINRRECQDVPVKSKFAESFLPEDEQITLEQLYNGDYPDRDEVFWDYVNSSDLEKPLTIQTLQRHRLKMMLLSQYAVEHEEELVDLLDDDQQEIIDHYKNDPQLSQKVIVISDGKIIDGNHRALAAVLKGVGIRYVDLDDSEEVLDEAPLPPDWDASQYAPGSTFKQRLSYALERAKRLGTGSSRVATTIEYQGRPTVLKIAKNKKGLAQNAAEASILSDGYARSMDILIPLIDYDEQNREPTWIHVEAAKKATEKTLCDLMKCPDLYMLYNFANSIAGQPHRSWSKEKNMDWMRENYSDSDIEIFLDYAQQLAELAVSFNVEIGDFTRAANWGIYQGRPVVIDIGFTTDVKNTYYNRR